MRLVDEKRWPPCCNFAGNMQIWTSRINWLVIYA